MARNQALYERALRFGQASIREERWAEAANAFKIAIRENPNTPEPYAGLGDAMMGENQLAKALDCYKLAGRISRGDVRYLQQVADVQERLGQLHEASRTYMACGEIYLRQRALSAAIDNWQRAVRLEPGLLGAHQRLASVFQRQGNHKAAVREYLAIARILQMRGEDDKALRMCRAALRLDPDNEDITMAIALIEHGEAGLEEDQWAEAAAVDEPALAVETTIMDTVRQMADLLETEKATWQLPRNKPVDMDPVSAARQLAQDQMAEEIFREESDEEPLYGSETEGLSKLERDALIGQGMDFQLRGRLRDAIGCYEKAIQGGLHLPAAHFTVGMLYHDLRHHQEARESLAMAAVDPVYRQAIMLVLRPAGF